MFKRILVAAMLAFIPLNVSSPTEAAVQAEMSVANNQVSVQQSKQLFNDEKNAISMLMPAGFLTKGEYTPDNEKIFQVNYSNVQMFIYVTPIDKSGPNSAKFIDEVLAELKKEIATEKDAELLENKIIKLDGRKTLHVVRKINAKPKTPDFIMDNYTLFTPNDMIDFRFNIEADYYEKFKASTINEMIASIKIGTKWKRFATPDNRYSYELPEDVYNAGAAFDHQMLGSNDDMMTGIMVQKIADNPKYSYYPQSLANLSAAEQADLDKKIIKQLKSEVRTARNIKNEFTVVNNLPCIKSSFDDVTSHSIAYIFIKDGNYISYDYIFNAKLASKLAPVLERSVNSIKF